MATWARFWGTTCFSRVLGPVDDSSHAHVETYRSIGGIPAELLVSISSSDGYTGVYFPNLGSSHLSLVGQDLTPEQQRNAVAMSRACVFNIS